MTEKSNIENNGVENGQVLNMMSVIRQKLVDMDAEKREIDSLDSLVENLRMGKILPKDAKEEANRLLKIRDDKNAIDIKQ